MNVFVQGMRRSGTTICYDILDEDPAFDCYYEPFAAANKEAIGGGSGARAQDFFIKIKKIRVEFREYYPALEDTSFLNYGAPRDALLEFEEDMPDYCKAYILFMLDQSPDSMIKFTRMYGKVGVLKEIDPDAKFVHIVRDPRAVTTSYLYGKKQKNKLMFEGSDLFFSRCSDKSAWSSYIFSNYILSLPEYMHLKSDIKDYERILLIWKFCFDRTHSCGLEFFGDNYHLLYHDSLILQTEKTLTSLYAFIERPIPDHVMAWAKSNVKKQPNIHDGNNRAWFDSIEKLNIKIQIQKNGFICE
jgi:hypothetical protein